MKIIEFEGGQGSPSWLTWRRSRITATDSGVICGLNPYKGLDELWQEKLGFIDPKPPNEAMRLGNLRESIARELLIKEIDVHFEPCVIESSEYYWMGSSLDGISQDRSTICEIKSPSRIDRHLQVAHGTYDKQYYCQMQHQLACSGADLCVFCSYHPDDPNGIIYLEVHPDKEFIASMIEKEKYFFEKNMCCMEPTAESWKFKEKYR